MKKFTESVDDSGTRDIDGTWLPETPHAKLRNKLGTFWTLSQLISDKERFQTLISSDTGKDLIVDTANQCELNKESILELIKIIEEL